MTLGNVFALILIVSILFIFFLVSIHFINPIKAAIFKFTVILSYLLSFEFLKPETIAIIIAYNNCPLLNIEASLSTDSEIRRYLILLSIITLILLNIIWAIYDIFVRRLANEARPMRRASELPSSCTSQVMANLSKEIQKENLKISRTSDAKKP